jgi:hypothetical protein
MEIEALYLWWTEERLLRPDPYEVSGWTAYCAEKHHAGQGLLESLDQPGRWEKTKPMHDIMNELEAKYEQEDEEMLIRLIKIRNSLWT